MSNIQIQPNSAEISKPSAPASSAAITTANDTIAILRQKAKIQRWNSWDDVSLKGKIPIHPDWRAKPYDYLTLLEYLVIYRNKLIATASAPALDSAIALRKAAHHAISLLNPNVKLAPQQEKAVDQTINALFQEKLGNAALVPLETGAGKSWICAAVIIWLQNNNWAGLFDSTDKYGVDTPKVMYFTRKRAIEKTLRTFRDLGVKSSGRLPFGNDVCVTHYAAMRTKKFSMFFKNSTMDFFGNEKKIFLWRGGQPVLIVLDECQDIKKWESQRSQRIWSFLFSDKNHKSRWLLTSATPGVVLKDYMLFACAANIPRNEYEQVDRQNVAAFLASFDKRGKIDAPVQASMERFKKHMGGLIVSPPRDPR
jgi:hypothetical protein